MSINGDIRDEFDGADVIVMRESDWERITALVKPHAELYAQMKALGIDLVSIKKAPHVPTWPRQLGETEVTKELGVLNVTTSGRTIPLNIVIEADTAVERDENGKLEFVHCEMCGYFDPVVWDVNKDGLLYQFDGVADQIIAFVASKGIPNVGGWSEQGMQGRDYVHLDMNYDALEAAFPGIEEFNMVQACDQA